MSFTPKLYWHIHHDKLLEVSTEPITNRKNYIKTHKPKSEQKIRLARLKPIKLTKELQEILTWLRRYYNYNYNYNYYYYYYNYYYYNYYYNYYNYLKLSLDQQIAVYMLVMFYQLVEALHEEQCPNCPWNGKELVFK